MKQVLYHYRPRYDESGCVPFGHVSDKVDVCDSTRRKCCNVSGAACVTGRS